MPNERDKFPFPRPIAVGAPEDPPGALSYKCKLTHALLSQRATIAQFTVLQNFWIVIKAAREDHMLKAEEFGLLGGPGQLTKEYLGPKLQRLEDALKANTSKIRCQRDLLVYDRVHWPADVEDASWALEGEIFLCHNYVPDRDDRQAEPKDDILRLFSESDYNMLGHIGTKTLTDFYQTARGDIDPYDLLLITLGRRLGVFEEYRDTTPGSSAGYGGTNDKCHYRPTSTTWGCAPKENYNCDIVNGVPSGFSDPCPPGYP